MPTNVVPLHATMEMLKELPLEHNLRGNFCSSAQNEIVECIIQKNTGMVEEEYNHKLIKRWQNGQFLQVELKVFGRERFIFAWQHGRGSERRITIQTQDLRRSGRMIFRRCVVEDNGNLKVESNREFPKVYAAHVSEKCLILINESLDHPREDGIFVIECYNADDFSPMKDINAFLDSMCIYKCDVDHETNDLVFQGIIFENPEEPTLDTAKFVAFFMRKTGELQENPILAHINNQPETLA